MSAFLTAALQVSDTPPTNCGAADAASRFMILDYLPTQISNCGRLAHRIAAGDDGKIDLWSSRWFSLEIHKKDSLGCSKKVTNPLF